MDDETTFQPYVADEPAPRLLRVGGILLLVAMAAAAVLIFSTEPSSGPVAAVLTVLALLLGIAAGGLLLVCRITVTVGATDVLVAFWPVYRKRLPVPDLVSVRDEPRLTPSMVGGGTGLRFATGNRVALLFGAGPATEIETSTGRTYLVVVRDSAALTAAVRRLIEYPV